jgi:putative ABC transport system permease protein
MMLFKLAFLNLFRHKARSLLSLLTISAAIASIIVFRGYSHNILESLKIAIVENQHGHLQIGNTKLWSPTSEKIKDQLFLMTPELQQKISSIKGLRTAAPRLTLQGLLTSEENQFGAKLIGYDPEAEKTFTNAVELVGGQHISDPNALQILLGAGLQTRLKAKVGNTVTVVTQTVDGVVNATDLIVQGIFQTSVAEIDNQVAFVPIKVTQTLLDTQQVENYILWLNNIDDTFKVFPEFKAEVQKIKPELTVKTWRDLADLFNRTEIFFETQNLIIQVILCDRV